MAGQASVTLPIPHDAGAPARLRLALVVSASFHLLVAQAFAPDIPRRHTQTAGILSINAWVERLPAAAGRPADVESDAPPDPGRAERPAAVVDAEPAGLSRVAQEASPPALPQLPDTTVYTARDLDSYPRPVAPLDTGRVEDTLAGKPVSVRFELIIDERGRVNEVVVAGPEPSGFAETELRALLAATPFIPARKDGRAVKSRVLLSISLVAKSGDRQ